MKISRRSIIKAASPIGIATGAAALMVNVDSGGTASLKFVLYFVTFGAGSFVTIFSRATACGWPSFRKQTKI